MAPQIPTSFCIGTFYYDAWPYAAKAHSPVSKQAIDYAKSDVAVFSKQAL